MLIHATPVPIAKHNKEAIFILDMVKVNAVVCEHTSECEMDTRAQRVAAVHNPARNLENTN